MSGSDTVGTCSLCGGAVVGVRGVWMSVLPPPPDRCTQCGAVERSAVIDMVPFRPLRQREGTGHERF